MRCKSSVKKLPLIVYSFQKKLLASNKSKKVVRYVVESR